MASEALVTDQTAEGHIEEKKVTDDTKKNDEESISQPKEIRGKDEGEKLEVEDSTNITVVTEEKTEAKESDTVIEEVIKEEDIVKGLEKVNNSTKEFDVSTLLELAVKGKEPIEAEEKPAENLESYPMQESESEATKEPSVPETTIKEVRSVEELKEFDVSTPLEPAVEVKEKEPIEAEGKPTENLESYPMQESESETSKEPSVPETAIKEVRSVEELKEFDVSTPLEPAVEVKEKEPIEAEEKPIEYLKSYPMQESESETTKEPSVPETAIKEVRSVEELKEFDVSSPLEPAVEVKEKEPIEAEGKPTENLESYPMQESESETTKEPSVPETAIKEVRSAEELKEFDVSPPLEPPVEVKEKEPIEAEEKPIENLESYPMQESESEATKEPSVPETAIKEVRSVEELKDFNVYTPLEPAIEVTEKEPIEAEEKPTENLESYPMQESESKATREPSIPETAIKEVRSVEELKEFDVYTPLEPAVEVKEKEPIEVEGKPTENLESYPMQESESKATKEPSFPETVIKEVRSVEELPKDSAEPNSGSETEHKPAEPPTVIGIPGGSESTEISQDVKISVEAETSSEPLKKQGEIVPEVSDVVEKSDADQYANSLLDVSVKEESEGGEMGDLMNAVVVNAGLPNLATTLGLVEETDTSSVTEIAESLVKAEVNVEEENREKTMDIAEPTEGEKAVGGTKTVENLEKDILVETVKDFDTAIEVVEVPYEGDKASEGVKVVMEKDDESVEGDKTTLVKKSNDLDATSKVAEISSEGEKASEGVELVEAKKDERWKGALDVAEVSSEEKNNESFVETSKALDATTEVAEAFSEGQKVSGGAELFEEKDESFEDDKASFDVISKGLDATTEVAEFSSEGEKASTAAEMVEEKKDVSSEADKATLAVASKDLDGTTKLAEVSSEGERASEAAEMVGESKDVSWEGDKATLVETTEDLNATTEAAEVSYEAEKSSEGSEMVEENKDESLEGEETLVDTSKDLDATTEVGEVSTEGEKAYGGVEMTKGKKDETLEGENIALVETSKDLDATAEVVEASSREERASEGAEMVQEKKDDFLDGDKATFIETAKDLDVAKASSEAEKDFGGAEKVEKKKNESLEGNKPISVETSKDLDVEEKNVIATSVKEPVVGSEEARSEVKPTEAIQTLEEKEEAGKPIDQNLITVTKDGADTKTDKETSPKQVLPAKPSQRHSNTIMSKVKHSIVKVKKAILGKSRCSKTISSEGKR